MNFKNCNLLRALWISTLTLLSTSLFALNITWTGGGDGTSWHDAANWDNETVPTNADIVNIGGTAMVSILSSAEANRLSLTDEAILTISSDGQLLFAGSFGDALRANNNSSINNNGIVVINQSEGEAIVLFGTSKLNNNNTLTINFSGEDGINLSETSTFTNNGFTTITNIGGDGINMEDDSKCFNYGSMSFELLDDFDPIDLTEGNTRFENYGAIEILNIINSGEGIEVAEGVFINTVTGDINMTNVTGDGVLVQSGGTFINEGYLNISVNPIVVQGGDDNNGIEVQCGSILRNQGVIEILNNGSTDAIELACSDAEFINEACGKISILSENKIDIESTGYFTNNGILSTEFKGVNTNNGTFINGGQITSPNGFQLIPNAIINAPTTPSGWQTSTIGNAGTLGNNFSFSGCEEEEVFIISGGGNNAISTATDNVAFTSQSLCGNDITITAKIESVDPNGYGGLMVRASTAAGAKQIAIFSNLTNSLRHEVRTATNAPKQVSSFFKPVSTWLRLQRQGDWFFAYYSSDGVNFQYVHAVMVSMNSCVEAGLASFTFLPDQQATTVYSDVTITGGTPAPMAEDPPFTEVQSIKQSPNLYPNPTHDMVNLTFGKELLDKNITVHLRNPLGQVIEQRQLLRDEFNSQWDVSMLSDGVYFFEIYQTGEAVQVLRLVKTK